MKFNRRFFKKAVLKSVNFIKNNKILFLQVGLMMLPAAVGFANDTISTSSVSTLTTPLSKLHSVLTGPIPKGIVGMSVAMGGCSWAMGWEQQITQRCIKGAGGGAVAMAGGEFLSELGIEGVSGLLF